MSKRVIFSPGAAMSTADHGPREIQHEHDVNAGRLGFDVIIRQPRPGQGDNSQRKDGQPQEKCKPSRRGPGLGHPKRAQSPRWKISAPTICQPCRAASAYTGSSASRPSSHGN